MIDAYSKVVLTVIAAALVAIAAKGLVGSATAQLASGCGSSGYKPCYVALMNTVEVQGTVSFAN